MWRCCCRASFAVAQQAPKKDDKKRSKQEQAEIEQIVKLVDGVMAGQPAPTDITMSIEPFFMKSAETRTFVPFVLDVKGAPSTDAAMYIRVVNPAAVPDPKAKKVEYPWDDIHFVTAAQLAGGKLNRVFMAVRRHLRRLRGDEGTAARKGAQDAGRQDGRAQDRRSPCPTSTTAS